MRLIDADALRRTMYEEAFEKDSEDQRWDGGCWIRYKMFEKAIESAPTIDTVKHGKWNVVHRDNRPFIAICNKCDARLYFTSKSDGLPNYCLNCGARMDGEDE